MSDELRPPENPEPPREDGKKRLEGRIEAKIEEELHRFEHRLEGAHELVKEDLRKVKRSIMQRVTRGMLWTAGGILALLLILFGLFAWYTTTADFERRVKAELVNVLGDATGGQVELAGVHFNLWRLAVEADGLVIHGLEPAGEAPYLSVDRVLLRVKILNFFSHAVGHGLASHIALNYLRVEHPQFHLIVDKDGRTNQPTPKHKSASKEPITDTLLDLRARQVELVNGVALFNQQKIPFDLAARDLDAEVHYLFHTDHYAATIDLRDLRTRIAKEPEAQSSLHLEAELGRDEGVLERLDLRTGATSHLEVKGTIAHFAKPEWKATATGSVEVRQVAVMTGLDTLRTGIVDLNLEARNCLATTPVAERKPPLWQRLQRLRKGPSTKVANAPVEVLPGCPASFIVAGMAKVHSAGYKDEYVNVRDVNATTRIHLTPDEFELSEMNAVLPTGGKVGGTMHIEHWLGAEPGPKAQPSKATIDATLSDVSLRTIMDVTAEREGDLGFDTAVSGPVKVEWGGSAKDVADTVEVGADLMARPTGARRARITANVPVAGHVLAHYTGKDETVRIQQLNLSTPGSSLTADGVLGVAAGDPLTALHVDLTARDLSEFDQLLTTLGLEAGGKKGVAAIPVSLHGALHFTGTAKGAARNLDVKGHVQASNIEFAMGQTDVLMDSVLADAEYSPSTGVAIADSTIHRGTAVLHASGRLEPRKEVSRRGVATYLWDNGMTMDATVDLAEAELADLLDIAGQKQKIPVTGRVSANAHVTGTMENLNGTGHIALLNGVAYGEPFDALTSNLLVHGKAIEVTDTVLKVHGMQVTGAGGYDLANEHLHGHLEGRDLDLARFETVKKTKVDANGRLSFVADANGTTAEPGLRANLRVDGVTYQGKPIGEASVESHSQGKTLFFTAKSTVVGAKLNLDGQTELVGDYQTRAKLDIADFDVSRPLGLFGPGNVKAQSAISGTATIGGPLKTPKALGGAAELNNADIKLQGVELKAAEPLRASLRDGVVTLDQVHITGQDTDMRLSGTAQMFGSNDPKGGRLNVKGSGSVSMALLHTFDPDVISGGRVEFTAAAGGQINNPALSGKVELKAVNLALDGVPNGLSDVNGTLIFTEDRLQVQSLTAKTGGGDLKIGGALRFRNGVYADLTATGEAVRVRLYGLSATANANLRLQGTTQSSLLSGNILVTRFGVGQDVDFAAFAGPSSTVSAPPDPSAPSNKVRLDVHVTSAPQLDFQNSYAKLAGSVDLNIRGTVAAPAILGRIQITDGSATFANTKYQLQRGDIYFTNPVRIDPAIDLDATAQVENYEVTIGLHGTASNLKPTYRSEPPLSEADIFALLALGRTQEEAQIYREQQLAAGTDPTTSALLGGALNATVSSKVEKLFGVGSVKIDPAFVGTLGNSSARITVQEQISKQVTATFATNVNTSAQQLIQVQYDLNHNSSIVVTRDESGVFSIVYKLRRRYR